MIFVWKRLIGLGQILDGITMLLTGRRLGLGLRAAKGVARERYRRMNSRVA